MRAATIYASRELSETNSIGTSPSNLPTFDTDSSSHHVPEFEPSQTETCRLLVVDDVPDNLFLMEAILSDEAGYELQCADSGKAALEALETSVPDLILLDIMMPEMNGYEVTRRIRENPTVQHVPIILVTAHSELPESAAAAANADGLIRKPFDIQVMLDTVKNTLQHKPVVACS